MTYGEHLEKEARMRILQALRDEPDRRRAVAALRAHLRERWVINRGQEWVDLQLDILRELGAVKIVAVNDLRVAVLAERGREHLDGETKLPGVRSPSEDA